MGPVFEHRLVDGLPLTQVIAPVSRNARVENVVMAAFDHVDGVDLDVAEMLHRRARPLRPVADGRGPVELQGAQTNTPGGGFGKREGYFGPPAHLQSVEPAFVYHGCRWATPIGLSRRYRTGRPKAKARTLGPD